MVDLAKFEFWTALQVAGLDKDYGPLIRLLRGNHPLYAISRSQAYGRKPGHPTLR